MSPFALRPATALRAQHIPRDRRRQAFPGRRNSDSCLSVSRRSGLCAGVLEGATRSSVCLGLMEEASLVAAAVAPPLIDHTGALAPELVAVSREVGLATAHKAVA